MDIGEDLLILVFSFLENKDLSSVIATCKKWNDLSEIGYFWKCAYHNFLKEQIVTLEKELNVLKSNKMVKTITLKIEHLKRTFDIHFAQDRKTKPSLDQMRKRLEKRSNNYYIIIYKHKISMYGQKIIRDISIIVKKKSLNGVREFVDRWERVKKLLKRLMIHDVYDQMWKSKINSLYILDQFSLDAHFVLNELVKACHSMILNTVTSNQHCSLKILTEFLLMNNELLENHHLISKEFVSANEKRNVKEMENDELLSLLKESKGMAQKIIGKFLELIYPRFVDFLENYNVFVDMETHLLVLDLFQILIDSNLLNDYHFLKFLIPFTSLWVKTLRETWSMKVKMLENKKNTKLNKRRYYRSPHETFKAILQIFVPHSPIDVLYDMIENNCILLNPKYYMEFETIDEMNKYNLTMFDQIPEVNPLIVLFANRLQGSQSWQNVAFEDNDMNMKKKKTFKDFVQKYELKIIWPSDIKTFCNSLQMNVGGLAGVMQYTADPEMQLWLVKKYMDLYCKSEEHKLKYRYLFEEALVSICSNLSVSLDMIKFLTKEFHLNPTKILHGVTSALIQFLRYSKIDDEYCIQVLKFWFEEYKDDDVKMNTNAEGCSQFSAISVALNCRSLNVIRYLMEKTGASPFSGWFESVCWRDDPDHDTLELIEIGLKANISINVDELVHQIKGIRSEQLISDIIHLVQKYGIQIQTE